MSCSQRVITWLSAFLLAVAPVEAKWYNIWGYNFEQVGPVENTSFVYDGYGYAQCGTNDYGLQLQALEILCFNDEDINVYTDEEGNEVNQYGNEYNPANYYIGQNFDADDYKVCSLGGGALVRGNFSASSDFPINGTIQTKICKWWGASCTRVLNTFTNFSLCEDEMIEPVSDVQGGAPGECGTEGYYGFNEYLTLPGANFNNITGFLEDTFKFTIHMRFVPWHNETDDRSNIDCHVQFRKFDPSEFRNYYQTKYGYAMIGVLGLLGLGGAYGFKNRQCCVQGDLDDDEEFDDEVNDFVCMGSDGKPAAARV